MQWFTQGFRDGGKTLAGSLPWPINGPTGRGAHSCGAVAEFHRLPEHPGDCRGRLRCHLQSSRYGMEEISMPSTFIDRKESKVKTCGAKKFAGSQKSFIGLQCRKEW
jgi:hypothetical protein